MPTRYDVSQVPVQGGYIAKQCPVKIQWDIISPTEPAPAPGMARLLMEAGNQFEDDTVATLELAADGPRVLVPTTTPEETTRLTVEAMERSAEVIIGGWLPLDPVGRRTGRPDALVFDGDGYIAVDIKHHLTLDESDGGSAMVSGFDRPSPGDAWGEPDKVLRKHKGDALQLRFGPIGLWKKRVPYAEITSAKPARSAFIDCWGVHWIPGRGWTWNIWGRDCVELRTTRGKLRIGTDDQAGLVALLSERIERNAA